MTDKLGLGFTVALFAIIVAAGIGWVMNVVKIFGLIGQNFDIVGVEMLIRGVCVFIAPLGAVAGYI